MVAGYMRFREIDLVRGIAVILMIGYHLFFDIKYFETHQNLYWLAVPIVSLFILVSGISLSISYSRGSAFSKFARRGVKLLFLGLVITAVTFLLLKSGFIIFGVLHFFGVSSFLIFPFLKYLKNNLAILIGGILIILAGFFISGYALENPYFLWFGFVPENFYSFDYVPLIPWFGVLLIGLFLGNTFYPNGKRNFKFSEFSSRTSGFIEFIGKNSLVIYFIHQPILLLILLLLGYGEFLSVFNF